MNKWKRFVRRNWLAALIASTILVTCLSLFYFKHPESPYHLRNQYVLRFEQIGTLSPGNKVRVNGLSRGEILSANLTEDAVFVTIEVLAHTAIPKNSSFRLINSGLMGEREVCILLGNSEEFLASGDTAIGQYDEGTSGITRKLKEAFNVLDSIMVTVQASIDSLIGGQNGKRISRLENKGNALLERANSMMVSGKNDIENLLSNTKNALQTAENILDKVKNEGSSSIEKIEEKKQEINALLDSLQMMKQKMDNLVESAPIPYLKEKELLDELKNLSAGMEKFRESLVKDGLKINVDIF